MSKSIATTSLPRGSTFMKVITVFAVLIAVVIAVGAVTAQQAVGQTDFACVTGGAVPTGSTRGIRSTALTTDKQGRRRHMGHRIETWARQTKHTDGITWFLSKLGAETRADPSSELLWSVPTARSDRAYNWGDSAIAPDAVGHLLADGLHVPFYLEHELRTRHPRGVLARLRPYESYYWVARA